MPRVAANPPPAPAVILVTPQMGENIGATARAMMNFGLRDLRLVAPRDGWPNPKALEMAAGGASIIEQAQVFSSLQEAAHDLHRLYATTARPRLMVKEVLTPAEAVRDIRVAMQEGSQCGLVFGPERSGLNNDDIALAAKIITIPVDPGYPSLNLGQSMVIVGYEWFAAGPLPDFPTPEETPATHQELAALFDHLERELDKAHFFKTEEIKPVMWRNLKSLFARAQMNSQEVRSLRGLIRALTEQERTP